MTDSEKLKFLNYALGNGVTDIDSIQRQIEASKREKYMKRNPYNIWRKINEDTLLMSQIIRE